MQQVQVKHFMIIAAGLMAAAPHAWAGDTPIGDFRLPSNAYTGGVYVETFSNNTRNTQEVLDDLTLPRAISTMTGISQNADGTLSDGVTPNGQEDLRLQTFSTATQIKSLNRFGSKPPGGANGPSRVGAVQWNFDLSQIDSYLVDNSLALSELDLGLVIAPSDFTRDYDVYLSYTDPTPAAEIALTGINTNVFVGDFDDVSSGSRRNYWDLWIPAQAAAVGDVVNGTHKVLALDNFGNLNLNTDLLSLYNAGVREFNLIMTSGAFLDGRSLVVKEGSGISISTIDGPAPIPGDVNGDGVVDTADFGIVAFNFGQTGLTRGQGDLNTDTNVNEADFGIVAANQGGGVVATAVPEPTSLLVMGLGGLALIRQRRQA